VTTSDERLRRQRPEHPTCFWPGCDRPREVAKSGRVYRQCEEHERIIRRRNRERDAPLSAARKARRVDAQIAAIAALPRRVPKRCASCFAWEMATGQIRECRNCEDGRRVLRRNEEWRSKRRG